MSEKKELKKFNKLSKGNDYLIYKNVSRRTLPKLLNIYNNDSNVNFQEDEVRLLLSLILNTSSKNKFSIAELNIIEEESSDKRIHFLSRLMKSSIMYENGWTKIASKEEVKANYYFDSTTKYSNDRLSIISKLIMAKKDIHKMEFLNAAQHLDFLDDTIGISWPKQLALILTEIKMGNIENAKILMAVFQNDKSIPIDIKEKTVLIVSNFILKPETLKSLNNFPSEYYRFLLKTLLYNSKLKPMLQLIDKRIISDL